MANIEALRRANNPSASFFQDLYDFIKNSRAEWNAVPGTDMLLMGYVSVMAEAAARGAVTPDYSQFNGKLGFIDRLFAKAQNDTDKQSISGVLSDVAAFSNLVRSKIDPSFPQVDATRVADTATQAWASNNDVSPLLNLARNIEGTPAFKSYFRLAVSTLVPDLVSKTKPAAAVDAKISAIFKEAQNDITTSASRNVPVQQQAQQVVQAFNIVNGLYSKKFGINATFDIKPISKMSAQGGKTNQKQPVNLQDPDVIRGAIRGGAMEGYDKFIEGKASIFDRLAVDSNINLTDVRQKFTDAKQVLYDSVERNFDAQTYFAYAAKRTPKNGKDYDPKSDAASLGRSAAAFVISTFLNDLKLSNSAPTSVVDELLKNIQKAAAKVMGSSAMLVGANFYKAFKDGLSKIGFTQNGMTAVETANPGSNVAPGVKRKMFIDYYESFKNLFTSKYNFAGKMDQVFNKYPHAQTPFEQSIQYLVSIWNDAAKSGAQDEETKKFLQMFYVGDRYEISAGLGGAFGRDVAKGEMKNVDSSVDRYAIEKSIDADEQNSIVLTQEKAGDIAIKRMLDAVEKASLNLPVSSEKPPSGYFVGLQSTKFTSIGNLPPLPVPLVPPGISAGAVKGGGIGGGENTLDTARRGSLFYGFCCGIGVARELRVMIGKMPEENSLVGAAPDGQQSGQGQAMGQQGSPIKLVDPGDAIRLTEEGAKGAGEHEPTAALPSGEVPKASDMALPGRG